MTKQLKYIQDNIISNDILLKSHVYNSYMIIKRDHDFPSVTLFNNADNSSGIPIETR